MSEKNTLVLSSKNFKLSIWTNKTVLFLKKYCFGQDKIGFNFAGIRVQSVSFAGQIFQVKTLDCLSAKCDILEVSIASDNPEILASTNNTLNLCIEDYGNLFYSATCQPEYLESCCQFATFFRPPRKDH